MRCWLAPPPSPAGGHSRGCVSEERGLPLATSGDFSWPPAGTSSGHQRGLSHGHGQALNRSHLVFRRPSRGSARPVSLTRAIVHSKRVLAHVGRHRADTSFGGPREVSTLGGFAINCGEDERRPVDPRWRNAGDASRRSRGPRRARAATSRRKVSVPTRVRGPRRCAGNGSIAQWARELEWVRPDGLSQWISTRGSFADAQRRSNPGRGSGR